MGRKPRIDAETGARLIEAYHRTGSKSEAARSLGLSQSTASRYLCTLPAALAPMVAEQQQLLHAAEALLQRVLQMYEDDLAWLDQQRARAERVYQQHPRTAEEAVQSVLAWRAAHAQRAAEVVRMLVDVRRLKSRKKT